MLSKITGYFKKFKGKYFSAESNELITLMVDEFNE